MSFKNIINPAWTASWNPLSTSGFAWTKSVHRRKPPFKACREMISKHVGKCGLFVRMHASTRVTSQSICSTFIRAWSQLTVLHLSPSMKTRCMCQCLCIHFHCTVRDTVQLQTSYQAKADFCETKNSFISSAWKQCLTTHHVCLGRKTAGVVN